MPTQLHLIEHQIDDLGLICEIGEPTLQRVAEELTTQKAILRPKQLIESIRKALGGEHDSGDLESIARLIISMRGLIRRMQLTAEEFADGLRLAMERDSGWEPSKLEKWPDVEPIFLELVWSNAARMVSNAIDLSYEYANLFRSARIITDIRPLFTDDASSIEAAVVSFTLRLHYDSDDASHEISIAMDEVDVKHLLEQCNRAFAKAATAQSTMKEFVPTFITGSAQDDQ